MLLEEGLRWTPNSDGASNKDGAGVGVVLESSSEVIIEEAFWLEKQMTNNEAEYKALMYRLFNSNTCSFIIVFFFFLLS